MTQPVEKRVQAPKTLLSLLVLLAFGLSFIKLPLFFGVDFVFASIIALVAASIYGPLWGVMVAVFPAAQTYFIWNHPYAGVVLLLEAAVVGILMKRSRANLAMVGFVYWMVAGIPLVYLAYRYGVKMTHEASLFTGLKQATNGVLNAVIASLVVTYVPKLRIFLYGRDPRVNLFETVFNVFIAAALIPAFFILTIDARQVVNDVEFEAKAKLTAIATGVHTSLSRWRDEHLRSIYMLSGAINRLGIQDRRGMQMLLEQHSVAWPNFHGTFVTDINGTTIAFVPLVNPRGQPTLGINFSDRPYFQEVISERSKLHVSQVFMARGGVFEPVFNVTAPISANGKPVGIVSGSLNLEELQPIFHAVVSDAAHVATLVDQNDNVIATMRSDLKPLDRYIDEVAPAPAEGMERTYRRTPMNHHLSPMTQWKESYLGQVTRISGPGNWKLFVEVPLGPFQVVLYERYGRILGLFLILTFVLLITSYWVASSIARPLVQLSRETTDIPERLDQKQEIRWPRSRLYEVSVLVQNFHDAIEALKKRFQDLEASRAQLDQANRTKDEFLSIASHELKTPLTPLRMQVQMLKRQAERSGGTALDPEKLKKALEVSDLQIVRLTRLIEDLLDVARINSGKLKLNPEDIDVAAVVREVTERYGPQLLAAGCEMTTDIPAQLKARVDPLRLEQVLANLLTNAAKYASGAPVEVSLAQSGGHYLIKVKDHGVGVPLEARARIFDRFERIASTSTVGGLGLGLFISRQIVEAHGGRLLLESEVNDGSAFIVSLPMFPDLPAPEPI